VCACLGLTVHSRLAMALFAALLGLTYGSGVGIFPTYLGDLYGVMSMPVLLGFVGLEGASVAALGPWIFGTVYDRTASYDLGFVIGLAFCVLSLACLFLIRAPVKSQTSRSHDG
jgi:MFS family permease